MERRPIVQKEYSDLIANPFDQSGKTEFCFASKSYSETRIFLSHAALFSDGFVVVTGQPGTGKTTLVNQLAESLATQHNVKTIVLDCNQLPAGGLLNGLAETFGISTSSASRDEVSQRLSTELQRMQLFDLRALLLLDEAQALDGLALQDLLLVNSLPGTGKPAIQIFFVGQPELHALMSGPSMKLIKPDIMGELELEPLQGEEVLPYIRNRFEQAGQKSTPDMDEAAISLIHAFSEGVPGRINLVCSRLFKLTGAEIHPHVGADDARMAIEQLTSEGLIDTWTAVAQEREPSGETGIPTGSLIQGPTGAAMEPETNFDDAEVMSGVTTDRDRIGHAPTPAESAHKTTRSRPTNRKPVRKRRGFRSVYLIIIALALLAGLIWLKYLQGDQRREETQAWLADKAASLQAEISGTQRQSQPDQRADIATPGPDQTRLPGARPDTAAFSHTSQVGTDNDSGTHPTAAAAGPPPATVTKAEAGDETIAMQASELMESSNLPTIENAKNATPAPAEQLTQPAAITDCQAGFQINFGNDSSQLSEEARNLLDHLADECLDIGTNKVKVTGYTDTWGDWDYNLRLSQRRADAVAQYLIRQGVNPDSVFTEGLGEYGFDQAASERPAANTTERRIVLLEIQAR